MSSEEGSDRSSETALEKKGQETAQETSEK